MAVVYEQPYIQCKNISADPECRTWLVLPISPLPVDYGYLDDPTQEETDEYLSRWPADTWKAAIACPSCGKVLEYDAQDVYWQEAPFYEEGRYHSDTTCFRVELECARQGCRLPVLFHIISADRIADQSSLLAWLSSGKLSAQCPNGHDLLPIPRNRYRIERILGAISSDVRPKHAHSINPEIRLTHDTGKINLIWLTDGEL